MNMKIIFMGSPDFALAALVKLIESKYNVMCVYSQPPRPAGRGKKLTETAVHQYAKNLNIPVFCPERLRADEEYEFFKKLNPALVVVSAYGLIIPQRFLEVPKYGFINIHPSDLPKFRGAAPIQRTILAGEMKTSMCIMQMDKGLDTGDVLLRKQVDISDNPTFQQLHDKLAIIGAEALIQVIDNIDNLNPQKQDDHLASYAAKIEKHEAKINAEDDLDFAIRKIRALNPRPGTYIELDNQKIKIIDSSFSYQTHEITPGTIIIEQNIMKIALKGGFLTPLVVQREGKNKISIKDFFLGLQSQFSFKQIS